MDVLLMFCLTLSSQIYYLRPDLSDDYKFHDQMLSHTQHLNTTHMK